jgi:predicted ferric reductase
VSLSSPPRASAGPGGARRLPRRRPVTVDLLALAGGAGLGAVVAQWWLTMPSLTGARVGGGSGSALLAVAQITGLVAAYLALLGLLLAARVPVIESTLGLDRLLRTHRRLGPWIIWLMLAHATLVVLAYSATDHTGVPAQAWTVVTTYEYVWMAALGVTLIVVAGLASWRVVRARLSYEAWWLLHLTMYLGVGLAFWHQIANGAAFIAHPAARAGWIVAYLAVFTSAALFRFGLPLARTLRYRLRVDSVHQEAPGIWSVVLRGRGLAALPLAGGQFALWRFLAPGLWWQAHPYSVSGLTHGDRLRITVKDAGDHSGALGRLRPGTRVLMEGPYGAFTAAARDPDRRALLIAGGVGIVPIRTLLDDLPGRARPILVYRTRTPADVLFRAELESLVKARHGRIVYQAGNRRRYPMDAMRLRAVVRDAPDRDWYVCGPPDLLRAALHAARDLRMPERRVHLEAFDFHGGPEI